MTISPYTNSFMKALPASLRPNPNVIDEHVMSAIEKGWHTDALAKACYINERNPNPGFVVTNLRTLCLHGPQQQTVRTGWNYGHIPCEDKFHPHECEICRCVPNNAVHHIVAKPNPEVVAAIREFGRGME